MKGPHNDNLFLIQPEYRIITVYMYGGTLDSSSLIPKDLTPCQSLEPEECPYGNKSMCSTGSLCIVVGLGIARNVTMVGMIRFVAERLVQCQSPVVWSLSHRHSLSTPQLHCPWHAPFPYLHLPQGADLHYVLRYSELL